MPRKFCKASKQGDIKDALDISEYLTDLLMGDLFQLASESLEHLSQVCYPVTGH